MNIVEFSIKRPVTTVMTILIVVILGVVSLLNLKQELMPEVDMGIAVVASSYDGAGPEEIETLVTKPLEGVLGTISNLKNISTTSSNGNSIVLLEFNDNTDMDNATLKMRENIDLVKNFLPEDVDPRVLQIDPNAVETITVGVTSDFDLVTLKNFVDDNIINRLEKLEGVGSVATNGGKEREISIELFPDKMAGYGINPSQISGLLAAENLNLPGGNLIQGDYELQIRTTGEFKSIAEIENLPVQTQKGALIYLRDLANVKDGFKKEKSYSIINGKEGITISITKQSTANTVDVANKVIEETERMKKDFENINFSITMDNSSFIKSTITNVWITVIQAVVLAFLVLLVFLGDMRTSLIIGVAIPISIVATLGLMYFSKITLNTVTLNALLISVGMLVDNSIVVLENITRHIDEGKDIKTASMIGANEVSISVIGSTLTTVVVFVPVLFVSGVAGKMFGQLGLVILYSLTASLGVSLTFVPMACSKFLGKRGKIKFKFFHSVWELWNKTFKKIENGYGKFLSICLNHKIIVVIVFLFFLFSTGSVIKYMGMEFTADMDEGYINIEITTPKGSLIEETSRAVNEVIDRLGDNQYIMEQSVSVGGSNSFSSRFRGSNTNQASIILKLIPKIERKSITLIADELRDVIGDITGAEVNVSSYMAGRGAFAGLGSNNAVNLSIYGEDIDILGEMGEDFLELISDIPNIRNISSSYQEGYPQANVVIDRNKASSYGLQGSAIANTVNLAISGKTVTKYKIKGNEIDVVLRYNPDRLSFLNDLENLTITSATGSVIPLYEIASITSEQGPASITKDNHKRYISISADFIGSDVNSMTKKIAQVLENYDFIEGYYYEFTGVYVMMMDSFKSLGIALILGFVLVYMVIASQFESLAYPGTILFAIPIAWTTGLFGVMITGNNISIIAIIGLILLMGIVVNNGIVLVDYINIKRKEGIATIDAIKIAGPVRLRPILMTTITTVLGLLPMLFSKGDGAEMQRPLGAVIAFGLTLSTLVTLILIPTLYLILHNIRKKLVKKRERIEII